MRSQDEGFRLVGESIARLNRAMRHVENRVANIPASILRYAQAVGDDGQTMICKTTGSSGWSGEGGNPDAYNNFKAWLYTIPPSPFTAVEGIECWVRSPDAGTLSESAWFIGRRATVNSDGKAIYAVIPGIVFGTEIDVVTSVCPIRSGIVIGGNTVNVVTDIQVEYGMLTLPNGTTLTAQNCVKNPGGCCGGDTSSCAYYNPIAKFWNVVLSGSGISAIDSISCVVDYDSATAGKCRWSNSHAGTQTTCPTNLCGAGLVMGFDITAVNTSTFFFQTAGAVVNVTLNLVGGVFNPNGTNVYTATFASQSACSSTFTTMTATITPG